MLTVDAYGDAGAGDSPRSVPGTPDIDDVQIQEVLQGWHQQDADTVTDVVHILDDEEPPHRPEGRDTAQASRRGRVRNRAAHADEKEALETSPRPDAGAEEGACTQTARPTWGWT